MSFGLASLFVAPDYTGHGSEDRVSLLVLRGDKVLSRQRCRGDAALFEDFDQLDALPRDVLKPLNG